MSIARNASMKKNAENEEPCFECLNEPENLHSHKPVNWEAKEK